MAQQWCSMVQNWFWTDHACSTVLNSLQSLTNSDTAVCKKSVAVVQSWRDEGVDQQPECPVIKEPSDLSDTSQVVETRPRAGTSVCVERQLLVNNNSEITNRLGCPQYASFSFIDFFLFYWFYLLPFVSMYVRRCWSPVEWCHSKFMMIMSCAKTSERSRCRSGGWLNADKST